MCIRYTVIEIIFYNQRHPFLKYHFIFLINNSCTYDIDLFSSNFSCRSVNIYLIIFGDYYLWNSAIHSKNVSIAKDNNNENKTVNPMWNKKNYYMQQQNM